MRNIAIQKIPGKFQVPPDWPKIEKIDLETGLIYEWDASTLDLGPLPDTGWKASVGDKSFVVQANTPNVEVVQDVNGVSGVKFEATRIGADLALSGDMTMLVTLRPSSTPASGGLRLLSGDANLFRGLYLDKNGFMVVVGANKATNSPQVIGTLPTEGEGTVVAARYGDKMDGLVLGQTRSIQFDVPGKPDQVRFMSGGNGGNPPSYFYKGLIYRYQMWNRLLSDKELEAAVTDNAKKYKIIE